jgi:hypothetical protein
MDKAIAINTVINNEVKYLHQHQLPNDEFCCYISLDDDRMQIEVQHSSVFPTSLIEYSLLNLRDISEVQEIYEHTVGFLQYQTLRDCIWPHFTSWTPLFKVCPPCADNTSCASKFLVANENI